MLKHSFEDFVYARVAENQTSQDTNPEWRAKRAEIEKIFIDLNNATDRKFLSLLETLEIEQGQLSEIACADCYYQGFKDAIQIFAGL